MVENKLVLSYAVKKPSELKQILTNGDFREYNKVTKHFYFLQNLERDEKVKIVIYVNLNMLFVVK